MPQGPAKFEPTVDERQPTVVARARFRYVSATHRAEQTWRRVEASRDRVPPVDLALQVYERDRDVAGPLLAGAIAFRLFLWSIPFTLAMVLILSFISDIATKAPDQLAREAGLGGYLVTTVAEATATSNQARWLLVLAGLWALLVASRSLTKTLRASYALAWRVRFPRGGITRLTVKVGGTFVGLVTVSMVAAALRARTSGPGLWIMLLMIVVFFSTWLWVTADLPHAGVPWTALAPGALLVAVGTQALYLLSVLWYVPRAASATSEYGALGLAILLLGWLFILGRLMVAAAVVNATLWARRSAAADGADSAEPSADRAP
jgi:uncharacterized BrkB/YihY/UPF0761 family membrane protein